MKILMILLALLGALPARLYSYGSAVFGATQQLAGAAGVALLVSVFSVQSAALVSSGVVGVEAVAGGVHAAFVVAACLSVAAIIGALFVRTPEPEGAPAGR